MKFKNTKLIYPELSYRIVGILFKVNNIFGRYYGEKQYQDAIENILKKENINFERKADLYNWCFISVLVLSL